MKKVIVIQGHLQFLTQLKTCYNSDVIISTWDSEVDSLDKYPNSIKSTPPKICGFRNCNLQFKSSYAGCLKAKELGYSQVLKIRSDIIIPEYIKLLDLLDLSVLNFFSFHNWDGGYYSDYIIGGPVDEMISLFEKYDYSCCTAPEVLLTRKVQYKPNYVLKTLVEHNISCKSLKWGRDLTISCSQDPLFIF